MTSSRRCRRGSPKNSASASSTTAWSCTASPKTAIAEPQGVRLNIRAVLRIAALVLLFLVCAPIHVLTKALLRRSPWPRWFLGTSAWIIGARARRTRESIRRHTLLVCNHTSWLDILVLGGATDCAFVSKAELGHPFIH